VLGETIGNFRLTVELGRGGMGTVEAANIAERSATLANLFGGDRPSFDIALELGDLSSVEGSIDQMMLSVVELEPEVAAAERWRESMQHVDVPSPADLERVSPSGTGPINVHFDTSVGTIDCVLVPASAPISAASFVGLATGQKPWVNSLGEVVTTHYYDYTTIRRVVPGIIAEWSGHPEGPGYTLPIEPIGTSTAGWLLLDRASNPVFSVSAAGLDDKGTIAAIAQCDASVDTMRKLAGVPADKDDAPIEPLRIDHVTVTR
jgi:peptidyl-prolyl cis-trans isomerase A (cyclophilin A)